MALFVTIGGFAVQATGHMALVFVSGGICCGFKDYGVAWDRYVCVWPCSFSLVPFVS